MTKLEFRAEPMSFLFRDNKAIIEIEHNLVQHDRTTHVEVGRHYQGEIRYIISLPFIK